MHTDPYYEVYAWQMLASTKADRLANSIEDYWTWLVPT